MNWIFEAYSNVYNVAAFQERVPAARAANAKKSGWPISRLLNRKAV